MVWFSYGLPLVLEHICELRPWAGALPVLHQLSGKKEESHTQFSGCEIRRPANQRQVSKILEPNLTRRVHWWRRFVMGWAQLCKKPGQLYARQSDQVSKTTGSQREILHYHNLEEWSRSTLGPPTARPHWNVISFLLEPNGNAHIRTGRVYNSPLVICESHALNFYRTDRQLGRRPNCKIQSLKQLHNQHSWISTHITTSTVRRKPCARFL